MVFEQPIYTGEDPFFYIPVLSTYFVKAVEPPEIAVDSMDKKL
jgi:hypothetical protein